MSYPADQIAALKGYCSKISLLTEGGQPYLLLESLQLPNGCDPASCDALLRPWQGAEGYPSQLFFQFRSSRPTRVIGTYSMSVSANGIGLRSPGA